MNRSFLFRRSKAKRFLNGQIMIRMHKHIGQFIRSEDGLTLVDCALLLVMAVILWLIYDSLFLTDHI